MRAVELDTGSATYKAHGKCGRATCAPEFAAAGGTVTVGCVDEQVHTLLYSWPTSGPLRVGEVIEDNVGTRPESVVKRRGRFVRGSLAGGCGAIREPLRGGETSEDTGTSFLDDCC
jgi:hypothetical protein